jgi:pre-mRNA branch site protein p14
MNLAKRNVRLAPEVNRILFVRNMPFKITATELYDLFGKYGKPLLTTGPIRQIRQGNTQDTRGTCYVVYDDIYDSKNACEHLSGFNLSGRYLIVLYHSQQKAGSARHKMTLEQKEREIAEMKRRAGV